MALWKKIICGVIALVVIGAGVAAFVFRDEIGAAVTGLRYSSEDLEQKLEENERAITEATQIVPNFTVRDLTEEEKQGLKEGTLTTEELIETLVQPVQTGEQTAESGSSGSEPVTQPQGSAQTQQNPGAQPTTQPQPDSGGKAPTQSQPAAGQPQVSDYQKQLASILAEVYVLRSEFLIALDNLLGQAKAEYLSIPAGERKAKLSSLAGKYFSKAYGLESQCDARMGAIINRMEALLKENGGDLSIAQTVYDTYLNEKSLKKSWYLAELRKRGI